jgi:hypothetical protein
MSDIFVKFSYGCKNIDFGIIAIKGWFLINGVTRIITGLPFFRPQMYGIAVNF